VVHASVAVPRAPSSTWRQNSGKINKYDRQTTVLYMHNVKLTRYMYIAINAAHLHRYRALLRAPP
jgi:hypothetical protein